MKDARREVRSAFSNAAAGYDAVAHFQRQVGEHLLGGLDPRHQPRIVVDLGCGTGHGSRLLARHYPTSMVVGLDFALPMVRQLDTGNGLCSDAECIPLASAAVDLLWSSLTLQWCDPARVFAEARRLLRPGGRLALATLGPGTFCEMRTAFAQADAYPHTIPFRSAQDLQGLLGAAGFTQIALEQVVLTRYYADLKNLFAAIRDLGANRVTVAERRSGLMGKAAWQRFQAAYEAQRVDAGLPLSYQTFFIHAAP